VSEISRNLVSNGRVEQFDTAERSDIAAPALNQTKSNQIKPVVIIFDDKLTLA